MNPRLQHADATLPRTVGNSADGPLNLLRVGPEILNRPSLLAAGPGDTQRLLVSLPSDTSFCT